MDVQGFGQQKGHTEIYRGHEFTVNLLRKVEIQIAVNEDYVERTIRSDYRGRTLRRSGPRRRREIFVLPIDDCIRIRTGERGPRSHLKDFSATDRLTSFVFAFSLNLQLLQRSITCFMFWYRCRIHSSALERREPRIPGRRG
ncbi:MAG: P-II family nitrogen regulator [Planctomycetota bacterium]